MFGGQSNHSWQLCFLFNFTPVGQTSRLFDGSDLKNSEYDQELSKDLSIDEMVGA